MAKRTNRPGMGFSLFELREDISQAVDLLNTALTRQGVSVDQDNLYLQIQTVVKAVGDGYSSNYGGYPAMSASEETAPYSVAGDLLAMGYANYSNGDKKEAVKNVFAAMQSDDFSEIVAGLVAMNSKSEIQKTVAAADDDSEDSDEDESDDDSDTSEEDQDDGDAEDDETDDLNDEEIDALIDDDNANTEDTDDSNKDDTEIQSDDEVNTSEESDEDNSEEETEEDKTTPMGGTSSTVTASHTSKVLANKLSLDGSRESMSKARLFLKKHPRVGT